jgi:serine/threonine protein phosphatase PrpC
MSIYKVGASTIGLSHIKKDEVNQDFFLIDETITGMVFVVADGHGSHKFADIGSKAVCKSVVDAIRKLERENLDLNILLPEIKRIWEYKISPKNKEECGTTCLFAFLNDTFLYVAQLGDGEIYTEIDGEFSVLKKKDDEFTNFTNGMSRVKSASEWSFKIQDIRNKEIRLALMTDGISETLIDGVERKFFEAIHKESERLFTNTARSKKIEKIIENWDKNHSGDDRTIILYKG